ncbi:uncharacterized protein PgNI_08973 [Pyricularia grisea]|uniref:Uncharacterized protein n=1 Tax=Pyricularia grisea TaxID=148305 RepID=A0A6P8AUX9_PYRGI|nr:uncharacterized protein PgNI_08973 [Pyricularia grisea]TLD06028.1 hypothetical protein PgNI_08973 [Pyricularia grisea]
MPAFDSVTAAPLQSTDNATTEQASIQFPPVTRDHILNCSYDAWFPKYRTSCLKSRIIKLSPEFVDYLREDGITLADEAEDDEDDWEPSIPTGVFKAPQPEPGQDQGEADSDSDDEDRDQQTPAKLPPNRRFPELHQKIKDEIKQLGGEVVPKLNWSSPKDATWIMLDKNTMRCTTPDDVYLLLKSSSFISHDLEHAFDGCATASQQQQTTQDSSAASSTSKLGFQPVLVLRPYFKPQPSLEFRCFVKQRNLVAISQRDLKNYDFLDSLRPAIIARVRELFNKVLRFTFPDDSFVFDVYIPEGDDDDDDETDCRLSRARLIDINPWAPRTDSLLFDWEELLDLRVPRPVLGTSGGEVGGGAPGLDTPSETDETTDDDEDEDDFEPELRLVSKDDPIESNFLSSQYSAHKLPKEVVDASAAGEGGMREFAQQWNQMMGARNGGS